jgi:hypothetical protein
VFHHPRQLRSRDFSQGFEQLSTLQDKDGLMERRKDSADPAIIPWECQAHGGICRGLQGLRACC